MTIMYHLLISFLDSRGKSELGLHKQGLSIKKATSLADASPLKVMLMMILG